MVPIQQDWPGNPIGKGHFCANSTHGWIHLFTKPKPYTPSLCQSKSSVNKNTVCKILPNPTLQPPNSVKVKHLGMGTFKIFLREILSQPFIQ